MPNFSRRDVLVKGSKLSLASFGLLAGLNAKALASEGQTSPQDIDVLNEILGTEHEGIATYQLCIEGHLLKKGTVRTAHIFQDHHKKHRDILTEKIKNLGGTPAVAKQQSAYASDLDFATLKTQNEALQLIVGLELGAANAYIGMLPSTNDHELAKIAGRIAADEVIHWTTLSSLLRLPLPTQALSFGA
jgi:bacterioferritin (cytochrome b1)